MIFEVFLYLNDTIDNYDDNVQEVEKDNEVCRDLFRLRFVFWLHQGSSNSLKTADFVVVSESMRLSIIVTMNSERLAASR